MNIFYINHFCYHQYSLIFTIQLPCKAEQRIKRYRLPNIIFTTVVWFGGACQVPGGCHVMQGQGRDGRRGRDNWLVGVQRSIMCLVSLSYYPPLCQHFTFSHINTKYIILTKLTWMVLLLALFGYMIITNMIWKGTRNIIFQGIEICA